MSFFVENHKMSLTRVDKLSVFTGIKNIEQHLTTISMMDIISEVTRYIIHEQAQGKDK